MQRLFCVLLVLGLATTSWGSDSCNLPLKDKRLPPLGLFDRWFIGKNELSFSTSPEGTVPGAEYLYIAGTAASPRAEEYSIPGTPAQPSWKWKEIADYLAGQKSGVSRGLLLQANEDELIFLNEFGALEVRPIGYSPARVSGIFLLPTGRDATSIVGSRAKKGEVLLSDSRLPSLIGENIRYASITFYPGPELRGTLSAEGRTQEFRGLRAPEAIRGVFEGSPFGRRAIVLGQSRDTLQVYDLGEKTIQDIALGSPTPATAIYRDGISLLTPEKRQ